MIKIATALLLLSIMFPVVASAASCPALTKQLARLRSEYQRSANSPDLKPDGSGFDELAEILDKIVDVKAEMRKSSCKIPPRPKSFDKDK
ncbi:MAG: hypothetical protein HY913_20475 [Desulfomonile tiedjei]|nr:hypothetical protein [Desulfomonile tiedjei]